MKVQEMTNQNTSAQKTQFQQVHTCSLTDAPRREPHVLGGQLVHTLVQVVHPKPDVVQSGNVDLRGSFGVDGLHQVDLNLVCAFAHHQDVLVHILFLDAHKMTN